jgi:hypothetical protein
MEIILKFTSQEEAETVLQRLKNIEELLELLLEKPHVEDAIRKQGRSSKRE